jgi:hypothetical protein
MRNYHTNGSTAARVVHADILEDKLYVPLLDVTLPTQGGPKLLAEKLIMTKGVVAGSRAAVSDYQDAALQWCG